MIIEFYSFNGDLPRSAALQAIGQAFDDASSIHNASSERIGVESLDYTFAQVQLWMRPREEMTSRMWRDGTWGLSHFVAMTPFGKCFSFLLLEHGIEGEVGWGAFTTVDFTADIQTTSAYQAHTNATSFRYQIPTRQLIQVW